MYIIPSFSTPLVSRAKNETIGDFFLVEVGALLYLTVL